jgi:hypothetical protein
MKQCPHTICFIAFLQRDTRAGTEGSRASGRAFGQGEMIPLPISNQHGPECGFDEGPFYLRGSAKGSLVTGLLLFRHLSAASTTANATFSWGKMSETHMFS